MSADRFFDLLPVVLRARDAEAGHPLRDLLRVPGEEADLLEQDLRRLYDDLFIETCEPWVIPYLGDLVDFRWLPVPSGRPDRDPVPAGALPPRRAVADTIRHRRRKGTLAVLEDLVPAVSGWPAVVCDGPDGPDECTGATADQVTVVVWRLPAWPLTHIRPFRVRRRTNSYAISVLGNDAPPFTGAAGIPRRLTVDALAADLAGHYGEGRDLCVYENGVAIPADRIRPRDLAAWRPEVFNREVAVDPERGRIMFPERYQVGTVTVSSLHGFPMAIGGGEYPRRVPGIPVVASFFRAGHLVDDGAPLTEALRTDPSAFTGHLRGMLDPAVFDPAGVHEELLQAELNRVIQAHDLFAALEEHGSAAVLDALDDEALLLRDAAPAGPGRVRLNRLVLEAAFPDGIRRSYAVIRVTAREAEPVIMNAVRHLQASSRPSLHLVVELTDSGLYVDAVTVEVAEYHTVELRAADGCRPTIVLPERSGDIDDMSFTCGAGSRVILDGIMVAAHPVRVAGDPAEVVVRHCTLVPGWKLDAACEPGNGAEPSLIVTDLPRPGAQRPYAGRAPAPTCVEIDHSIVGTVVVQRDEVLGDPVRLHVRTSVVDSTEPEAEAVAAPNERPAHATATFVDCTVVGTTSVHEIALAENSIFTGRVDVVRRQTGCLRFCSVAPGSRTPRRHACQPDLAMAAAGEAEPGPEAERVRPTFVTTRYGRPDYVRLADDAAPEIRTGADDGSEMGVYHDVHEPQRSANLRAAVEEYVPLGWGLVVRNQS
jgi:hypothetical protein